MFKRRKTEAGEHVFPSQVAPTTPPAPATVSERTTCYPQDGDPPPAVAGQPRTTVYRQAVKWNRGGYDTLN
jgi:hypothetical protein